MARCSFHPHRGGRLEVGARTGHLDAAYVPGGDRVLLGPKPPRLPGEDRRSGGDRGGAEGFAPYLLVRNDTDGLEPGVLEGVPCWVEVLYSDSMDAKICLAGRVEEARDMSTQGLLRVADEAADLLHQQQ